jgi:hypothetical protein
MSSLPSARGSRMLPSLDLTGKSGFSFRPSTFRHRLAPRVSAPTIDQRLQESRSSCFMRSDPPGLTGSTKTAACPSLDVLRGGGKAQPGDSLESRKTSSNDRPGKGSGRFGPTSWKIIPGIAGKSDCAIPLITSPIVAPATPATTIIARIEKRTRGTFSTSASCHWCSLDQPQLN